MLQARDYKYRGAWALVQLHDREMRAFLATWRRARSANIKLPHSEDLDCQSLEHMLRHVLGASRGYITWICNVLEIPEPALEAVPDASEVSDRADDYLDDLLARWDGPLVALTEEQAVVPEHVSRWKVRYCIDAMLEHAVMHPIRHRFQLECLLDGART